MKGKWLKRKNSGKAKYVYTVHGSAKEIAEYIEHQGENVRFLQKDGSIGVDETATPVFYSTKIVGKNPTLRFSEDLYDGQGGYLAEVNFEDAVYMDAVTSQFSPSDEVTSSTEEEEEEQQAPADLEQPKAKAKITPTPVGKGAAKTSRKTG
jgi:hypothetical protein